MYSVPANFHTLAIADSPKTRCRIYFISDAVNCWDDNDVQTNGTLLVGAAGDTDSNGRIGQGGVTVTEIFNKDKNLTIGGTVSYQIGMTLVNSDGALNNFAFGRCKVYLDVYDDANSAWLPCPLGVFRIEIPVKRKVQLIYCTGYDQMQALNAIADTWWNGLDFSNGLTMVDILDSMVLQLGLNLSSTSTNRMLNQTVSFTEAPFDSVERTYRDILGWIAEATGTVARFNRDGKLQLNEILTINRLINTDTVGNQCLSLDIADYTVSKIDALTIKLTTADQGVTVGSGTNVYTIMDNPFLYGDTVAAIQSKLTPIYNRLDSIFYVYNPISIRLIYDWSFEAGDLLTIVNNSRQYNLPIFQQKLTWRGGYVVAELISSGDPVRPQVSSNERETYRYNREIATKVGDNEIISRINQTSEQITIQANRLNLLGYTTINNGFVVNMDGTFEANGATINGKVVSDGTYDDVIVDDGLITFKNANDTTIAFVGDNGLGYAEINFIQPNARSYVWASGFAITDANNHYKVKITDASADFDVPVSATELTINGDGITTTDATVNGFLDVTPLRSTATISTAGWYRLTSCSLSGSTIRVSVGVGSAQTIDFTVYLASSTAVKIVYDSVSVSSAFDKIRVNLGDGKFHIDLHKANNSTLNARVDLLPSGNAKGENALTQAGFSAVSDSPASETELTHVAVTKNVPISSPTSLMAYGTIVNSTTFTYTATEPCWFYYVPVLQAGSSGAFEVQLNGVVLASYTSGEAIGVNVAAIPVPMQTGDVLYISQNSNRTSSYRVLTMRNVSNLM